ncbi:hypothetical protein [Bradyrhizobium sp. WSM3983]|uniref:hypothetical protein n=1 Tax=Bradyrhizobium sp. WSM3983 TaxID=1038867 RepID=UPI000424B70F|nr:hypothetical protein [Bradyrhizobium sp. WSM3983]
MSETYPFRLRVLQALTDRLKLITPANGYKSDLTDAVFRGRIAFGDNDPLPMVSILEPPVPNDPLDSPSASGINKFDWLMLLQGFVEDDPKNPTDPAHVLMADVRQMLAKERQKGLPDNNIFGMSGGVDDVIIGIGVVRPSDEISAKAYFWLNLTVKIVEDMADPYV